MQGQDIPVVPGLDTESGLARCGGNLVVYRKILRKFCETQADSPRRIREALAAGDRTTAEREAHTLKGVAGNIGADSVQVAATALEVCIKQDTDPNRALAALDRPLGALIETLSSEKISQEPANDRGPLPPSDLIPLLDRLQVLLEENDAEAGDLVAQIESSVTDDQLGSRIQAISGYIDDFEFDDAQQLLKELRDSNKSW